MNMQAMVKQAQQLQKKMLEDKKVLDSTVYEGVSSFVSVKINGEKKALSVKIDSDSLSSKEDIEMLEDMILIAFNDAVSKADKDSNDKMSKYSNGLPGLF